MKIVYTHTDEAPALATQSLLPIVRTFAAPAGVEIELRDISLAGRILAQFPDPHGQRSRTRSPSSASWPRRPRRTSSSCRTSAPRCRSSSARSRSCRRRGSTIPDYPEEPSTDEERDVRDALRRGEGLGGEPGAARGQLRPPRARVGQGLRQVPSALDGGVVIGLAHPRGDDGRRRLPLDRAVGDRRRGRTTCASSTWPRTARSRCSRSRSPLLAGEVIDAAVMRRAALEAFLAEQVADARESGLLFSLHLKATMMKVSDPIIFGHAVRVMFGELFDKRPGIAPDDGLARSPRPTTTRRPRSTPCWRTAPPSTWSTPTAASPTCTCPAT